MKNKIKHIHFVGIGGIGVSSLARYFISEGYKISGSDTSTQPLDIKDTGIKLFSEHSAQNISADIDLVIYSMAVKSDNPEIMKAKEMGIDIQSYPEALGKLTKKYYTIAVSGTHGKSTTTGMLSVVMAYAGCDPTVIIGTKLKEFNNTNFRKGKSKYLVIEADEWRAAFLNYYPKIAIITNIEEDHLDFYKDIDDIVSTFSKYIVNNIKKETLIINNDDYNSKKIEKGFTGELIKYSLSDNDKLDIKLSVPGKHNLYNALAVYHACLKMGINKKTILNGLQKFNGTWRRFDEKEVILKNGCKVKIINDYAHHPTAVKATISAVKEKYPNQKIFAVLQPHQYQRTYSLFPLFKKVIPFCCKKIKEMIILDIYTAKGREGEELATKINSEMLCDGVENAICTGSMENTAEYLHNVLHGGEILVIMGAGDVYYKLGNLIGE